MVDKKELELSLENTPEIREPREELEQYTTPPSIAASLLWEALMRNDIVGKTVLDLGCGSLRLGIGALLLGAKRVIGVDIDYKVLLEARNWLRENNLYHRTLLITGDAGYIELKNVDTTIMNPPFGVKPCRRGADTLFLRKALSISRSVYSIHKDSPGFRSLLKNIAEAFNSRISYISRARYPIKMMLPHHRRRVYRIDVLLVAIRKGGYHGDAEE
ncbi:50S ribosomal protein L11 methyltransferase [Desulfurococcaceae archaeon MEX13E-LK6-19]|nr:50S ribosomal protein L11 methyltransferase [Desulfurococcaceae archaeon MEX13E-LK6-19]